MSENIDRKGIQLTRALKSRHIFMLSWGRDWHRAVHGLWCHH